MLVQRNCTLINTYVQTSNTFMSCITRESFLKLVQRMTFKLLTLLYFLSEMERGTSIDESRYLVYPPGFGNKVQVIWFS